MTSKTFIYCDICNEIIKETPTKTPRCFSIRIYRHHYRDAMCGTGLLSKDRDNLMCCHTCSVELTKACFAFDDNITKVISTRIKERQQELQNTTKLEPEVLMPVVKGPPCEVCEVNDLDELKNMVSKIFGPIFSCVFGKENSK